MIIYYVELRQGISHIQAITCSYLVINIMCELPLPSIKGNFLALLDAYAYPAINSFYLHCRLVFFFLSRAELHFFLGGGKHIYLTLNMYFLFIPCSTVMDNNSFVYRKVHILFQLLLSIVSVDIQIIRSSLSGLWSAQLLPLNFEVPLQKWTACTYLVCLFVCFPCATGSLLINVILDVWAVALIDSFNWLLYQVFRSKFKQDIIVRYLKSFCYKWPI